MYQLPKYICGLDDLKPSLLSVLGTASSAESKPTSLRKNTNSLVSGKQLKVPKIGN